MWSLVKGLIPLKLKLVRISSSLLALSDSLSLSLLIGNEFMFLVIQQEEHVIPVLFGYFGNISIGNIFILFNYFGNIFVLFGYFGNIPVLFGYFGNIPILFGNFGNILVLFDYFGNISVGNIPVLFGYFGTSPWVTSLFYLTFGNISVREHSIPFLCMEHTLGYPHIFYSGLRLTLFFSPIWRGDLWCTWDRLHV